MVREEDRKLLLQEAENEQAVNRMADALLVHKADGLPGGSKRWCSKCKKSTHETSKCWADEACVYCRKKGHIEKVCHLRKENDKAKRSEASSKSYRR
jgi:hypothetical protein